MGVVSGQNFSAAAGTPFLKILATPLEPARKFNVNAIDCSSVLRVICPCCLVCVFCVIPFLALFLCFFYLIFFLVS